MVRRLVPRHLSGLLQRAGELFDDAGERCGWFNLVEGIVNHEILGVHHVNELRPISERIYWDMGFLIWGVAMIVVGWLLLRAGKTKTARTSLAPA